MICGPRQHPSQAGIQLEAGHLHCRHPLVNVPILKCIRRITACGCAMCSAALHAQADLETAIQPLCRKTPPTQSLACEDSAERRARAPVESGRAPRHPQGLQGMLTL